jgi:hypothetical protein
MLVHTPWRWMTAPRNIYGIAREMGRPVARGEIPLVQAHAALIVDTLAQERSGELGEFRAHDVVRLKRHLLGLEVHRHQVARALTEHRIKRFIKPMIAARKPPNAILSEAHGINGAAGFPLAEDEVTDIVKERIYWALPEAPWERRHVG